MNYTERRQNTVPSVELERLDGIAGLAVERPRDAELSGPTGEFTRS